VVDTEVSRDEASFIPAEIVTLRIRTETGKHTLIVKMKISDKMSSVYKAVRPYIEKREVA
jgi:hypothetical protein